MRTPVTARVHCEITYMDETVCHLRRTTPEAIFLSRKQGFIVWKGDTVCVTVWNALHGRTDAAKFSA